MRKPAPWKTRRICPTCTGGFTPYHRKQVYCQTVCRVKAWQKRTGYIHVSRRGDCNKK